MEIICIVLMGLMALNLKKDIEADYWKGIEIL